MNIEEQFKNYFNLGLIGIAITSLEKGWVTVNSKLCEILGYPQEELIKLSWAEITYPDDLEADEAEFKRVLAGEIEGYSIDKRFIRKDGKIIYASISANCVRKDDGNIEHFVAFVQDISERKQAEEKINKAYTLLKTAEKLTHIGSWEWEIEKDTFTMSDEWLQIHGVTKRNITMNELILIAHPDDVKTIEKHFKNALDGVRTYEIIHRIIRQDNGKVRFVNAKGVVSFNEQGKPYRVQGTAQDITEKVISEKALKESDKRFKTLFEESPFGILLCESIKDKKGKLINYKHLQGNKSNGNYLGIEEDIIGKTALEISDSEQTKGLILRFDSMLLSNKPISYTEYFSVINKSLKITALPLNNEQFILNVIDVTDQKQAEKDLEEHRNHLEALVNERTHDLTTVNEKLKSEIVRREKIALELVDREANLEKANAGKSRFLAAASHDLRQPLQSLEMYFSVMTRQFDQAERLDTQKLKEIGNKIHQSIDTMGDLLASLLDISKLDSGSVIPEKHNIQLPELLDRIITNNTQQAKEKNLQLIRTGEDCIVHSDLGLLERIIENFVTNAIRYTDRGSIIIDCRCAHDIARISVIDTGVGIPEDEIDSVFEEYYQLNNKTRDRRLGLGLGLSIVRLIAGILDHPLNVSSTLGKGSAFAVDVPMGKEIAPLETPTPKNGVRGGKNIVVLFVDDDPSIIDATAMLLESINMEVYTALNGDAALAHLSAGVQPSVIVSDFRLPHYNGIEVIRRVREATVNDLPAIIITGDTSAPEIITASTTNCTVLHKPTRADELIALIKKNHILADST